MLVASELGVPMTAVQSLGLERAGGERHRA